MIQTHNEGRPQIKFLAEQQRMSFLGDRTEPPEVIRVGSACVIRSFGSGFVVASGDSRLEALAVSSTLERAIAAVLAEPAYDKDDDPDWEVAVAEGLRTLRRAIDRTKKTLSAAGNDQVPNGVVCKVLRSAVDDLAALRDNVAEQQAALRADVGSHVATLETRAQYLGKKPTLELLNRLAIECGISWSGIAQSIGVRVQAIRKWLYSGSIRIKIDGGASHQEMEQ